MVESFSYLLSLHIPLYSWNTSFHSQCRRKTFLQKDIQVPEISCPKENYATIRYTDINDESIQRWQKCLSNKWYCLATDIYFLLYFPAHQYLHVLFFAFFHCITCPASNQVNGSTTFEALTTELMRRWLPSPITQ